MILRSINRIFLATSIPYHYTILYICLCEKHAFILKQLLPSLPLVRAHYRKTQGHDRSIEGDGTT